MANSFLARWLSLQWFIFVYFAFFCFFFIAFNESSVSFQPDLILSRFGLILLHLRSASFFSQYTQCFSSHCSVAFGFLSHSMQRLLSTSKSSTRCFELAKALHGRMMFFLVSEIPSWCHPGGFFAQPVLSNSDPTTYILLKITFFSSSGESPRMTVNWERIWYC